MDDIRCLFVTVAVLIVKSQEIISQLNLVVMDEYKTDN